MRLTLKSTDTGEISLRSVKKGTRDLKTFYHVFQLKSLTLVSTFFKVVIEDLVCIISGQVSAMSRETNSTEKFW